MKKIKWLFVAIILMGTTLIRIVSKSRKLFVEQQLSE